MQADSAWSSLREEAQWVLASFTVVFYSKNYASIFRGQRISICHAKTTTRVKDQDHSSETISVALSWYAISYLVSKKFCIALIAIKYQNNLEHAQCASRTRTRRTSWRIKVDRVLLRWSGRAFQVDGSSLHERIYIQEKFLRMLNASCG